MNAVHKPRYRRKPKKSVVVVRKVELAIAGSNLKLFKDLYLVLLMFKF